jgi:AcrR family transcriptional regulator
MKVKSTAIPVGRPRAFDIDEALSRALEVFWCKGYEGASLSDLTEAMGINRPSLYAAFGNKESLFRKALDRYETGPAAFCRAALEAPTAREVAERLLLGAADAQTTPGRPHGCLAVRAALSCGSEADPLRRELMSRQAAGQKALRQRLERAKTEGDLPPGTDPADLARYLSAVMQGMSILASGGANREELRRLAKTALRGWPGK